MPLPEDAEVDFSKIDLGDMTLGELEELEEIAGVEAVARALAGKVGIKVAVGLAYLMLRKEHPDVSLADVRARKVSIIQMGQAKAPNRRRASA